MCISEDFIQKIHFLAEQYAFKNIQLLMGHTVGILILGIATNDFSAVLAFGTFFTRVSTPRRRTTTRTTTKLLSGPLSVARGQKTMQK